MSWLVGVSIVLNSVFISVEVDMSQPKIGTDAQSGDDFNDRIGFFVLECFFLTVFVVEMLLKLKCRGWEYFLDGWNTFDYLLVMLGLMDLILSLMVHFGGTSAPEPENEDGVNYGTRRLAMGAVGDSNDAMLAGSSSGGSISGSARIGVPGGLRGSKTIIDNANTAASSAGSNLANDPNLASGDIVSAGDMDSESIVGLLGQTLYDEMANVDVMMMAQEGMMAPLRFLNAKKNDGGNDTQIFTAFRMLRLLRIVRQIRLLRMFQDLWKVVRGEGELSKICTVPLR
jgi:hypothetical protein